MPTDTIVCQTCGDGCSEGVTAVEKDPPGQLIMMCDHRTETYSLESYDAERLPPTAELPDEWTKEDETA